MLAPILPPRPPLPPPPRAFGGRPGPWGGPSGPAGRGAGQDTEEGPAEGDDQPGEEEYGEADEEYEESNEAASDEGEAEDGEDSADDAEDAEDGDAEDEGAEEVGAETAAPVQRHHVHQAMSLLNAAQRNPGARKRVRRIVHLAQVGDPTAKKALSALKVAKHLKGATKVKAALPAVAMAKPQTALAPSVSTVAVSTVAPATPGMSRLRRLLDVFAPWRQGVG
jgi:hypothetical protein